MLPMDDSRTDVNAQDDMGRTALILASWKGRSERVRILLQNGADALTSTRDGFTCLHMAAFCGHTEIVNLLLHGKTTRKLLDDGDPSLPFLPCRSRLALLDRKSTSGKFTALHLAACGDHDEGVAISESLLEAYRTSILEIYGLASNPKTAYQIENQLWLDYLLQIRNEVNLQDGEISSRAILENLASYGNQGHPGSALQEQLQLENYEGLVRSFVEVVSYSNAGDKLGRTPLHYAAWQNEAELVKFLLWSDSELGSVAQVNAMDVDGYTPLHFASRNGCRDVVIALLRADVVADVKDFELSTRQNQLVTKIYLKPNAAAKPTGHSRNLAAEIEGQKELQSVNLLLPRPEMQNLVWAEHRAGVTPLHYAVEKGHTEIVELLLEHPDIDVFHRASDGSSPWTIAFPSHGKKSGLSPTNVIQRLLRSGRTQRCEVPDVMQRRSYRQRLVKQAAALAVIVEEENSDYTDAAEELLTLEMQIFVTFVEDMTKGCKKIMQLILDESFRVELRPHSSWENAMNTFLLENSELIECLNLLHVAAYEGYVEELQTLLSVNRYKERINDRENLTCAGHTALHFAILRCRVNTGGLVLLLNEKTLRPTEMNKKGQTPLQVVEHLLDNYRSMCKLPQAPEERTGALGVADQLGIKISRSWLHALMEMTRLQFVQYLLGIHYLRSFTSEVKEKMIRRLPKKVRKGPLKVVQLKPLLNAEQLLMGRLEVQQSLERLYRDRELYSNAANAILVGAALIATISYQGWDQPPKDTTGHGVYAVVFGSFNSLSFSAAIAAVLTAAAASLPSQGNSIYFQKEVRKVRKWFFVSSSLLAISIYCIVGSVLDASISIGQFRVLENWNLWVGLILVMGALQVFVSRLHTSVGTRLAQIAKFLAIAILSVALIWPFIKF